ncbi:hypothetical protein [Chitinophaga sancti]|uniref:hypothetical protein n=1 Tax=Chitinophaga sancti TaxID=1004 RepID=UPI003F78C078
MRPNEPLLYAATSANLYNFAGNADFDRHPELFRTILSNSSKAFNDLFDFSIDDVSLIDEKHVFRDLKTSPRIFISFHTGSYYALPAWLLKHGHDVIVLSDTQSVKSGDFNGVTELYRNRYQNNCHVELINVEKQGAIFKVIKRIKAGAIVIAYIDGNKGIGGQTMQNENMLTLDFLKGKVKVRKGMVYLSCLTGVPVQLVLSHEEDGASCLACCGESFSAEGEDRDVFAGKVLQAIMHQFGHHVSKYYTQWANWPYVHHWSLIDAFTAGESAEDLQWDINGQWMLHLSHCCPLKLNDKYYVFDRTRYSLFLLDEQYIGLFSYKSTPAERVQLAARIIESDPAMTAELLSWRVISHL